MAGVTQEGTAFQDNARFVGCIFGKQEGEGLNPSNKYRKDNVILY